MISDEPHIDVEDIVCATEDWEEATNLVAGIIVSLAENLGDPPTFFLEALLAEVTTADYQLHRCTAVLPADRAGEATRLAAAHQPEDEERILRSPAYVALTQAIPSWVNLNAGRRRRDLLAQNKTAATLVEAEIRAIWDDILGTRLNLDGSAGSGTDIPIANVDVKAVRTGQSGALMTCNCEVVLGLSQHLVVMHYSIVEKGRDRGRVTVDGLQFIPSWRTADMTAAALAEELRQAVNEGSLTASEAASSLHATGLLGRSGVCERLLAALEGLEPIPQGVVTISVIPQTARVRYRKPDPASEVKLTIPALPGPEKLRAARRRRLGKTSG